MTAKAKRKNTTTAARKRAAAAAPAPKTGRPTKRTEAIVFEIIERVSVGTPLAEICRDEHMPGLRTVYDWLEADGDLSARFARAREAGFDMIAAEALRIADTPCEGKRVKKNDDGTETVTEDMLGHRRLQIDTRLKLLSKWDPKRYGDRLELDGKVDGQHVVRLVNLTGRKIGGGNGSDRN